MAAAPRPAYFLGGTTPPNASISKGTGSTGTTGTTTSTKPAAPFDWTAYAKLMNAPVDLSGVTKIADTRAAAETNATIAGIRALQDQATQQAVLRATQQNQLGIASSNYLQGLDLGGQSADDYARAAAAQRAAAAGYSGGLQQTVSDAAAKVQAGLTAAGSQQTAVNQGGAAGDALYGLGGNLPSLQLDAIGPTVAAGLRALPAQNLGYGQQLAFGELGAGQQEAAKLTPDIVAARANQGALAAKYFDSLSSAALQAGQDRTANLFKLLSAKQSADSAAALANYRNRPVLRGTLATGITSTNPTTGVTTIISQPQTKPRYEKDGFGRLVEFNPDGTSTVRSTGKISGPGGAVLEVGIDGKIKSLIPGVVTPHYHGFSDAIGSYLINEDTMQRTKIGGPPASATRAPSDAAGTAIARLDPSRSAYNGVASDQYGDPINYGTKAKPVYRISPGWHWGKDKTPVKNVKPGSTSGWRIQVKDATTLAGQLSQAAGVKYAGGVAVPGTGRQALSYQDTLQQVVTLGPSTRKWTTKATQIVNAAYAPQWSAAIQLGRQQGKSDVEIRDDLLQELPASIVDSLLPHLPSQSVLNYGGQ